MASVLTCARALSVAFALGCAPSPAAPPPDATASVDARPTTILVAPVTVEPDTSKQAGPDVSSSASARGSAAPSAPSKEALSAARELFLAATQEYEKGDFSAALRDFQAAYNLARIPKVLYNVGQAALQVGDRAAACDAFQRYVTDSGPGIAPERVAELKKTCPGIR